MKTLIENFSGQLSEAVKIGEAAELASCDKTLTNVLVSGLGGSGIGGTIVSQLTAGDANVPINVNKEYGIPKYISENSLVIISSYSGNTEETLQSMEYAISSGAEVACITSGGEVLKIAQENNLNHIVVPGGMPPRACLGYSLTQLLYLLDHYGITSYDFRNDLRASIDLLIQEEDNITEEAKKVAESLSNKIPIIYSTAGFEGVSIRFRQQLNENSKMLCWHHVFPEMNHNELVGWRNKSEDIAVVLLRNDSDPERVKTRVEICKDIFSKYCSTIIEVNSKGSSALENTLYHIHLGDWISWYLSEINQVDATEIDVINFLKNELSKQ
ncbi:MAG TPA: bifunctional phosphoglucose/phosphomannose isomerase [Flavobacteriales bacterium]|nr:bifunctional phosphoglucose/phosphomannose isomerase [Flavobacteriales bacterium]